MADRACLRSPLTRLRGLKLHIPENLRSIQKSLKLVRPIQQLTISREMTADAAGGYALDASLLQVIANPRYVELIIVLLFLGGLSQGYQGKRYHIFGQ
jgi:hypothetical protein